MNTIDDFARKSDWSVPVRFMEEYNRLLKKYNLPSCELPDTIADDLFLEENKSPYAEADLVELLKLYRAILEAGAGLDQIHIKIGKNTIKIKNKASICLLAGSIQTGIGNLFFDRSAGEDIKEADLGKEIEKAKLYSEFAKRLSGNNGNNLPLIGFQAKQWYLTCCDKIKGFTGLNKTDKYNFVGSLLEAGGFLSGTYYLNRETDNERLKDIDYYIKSIEKITEELKASVPQAGSRSTE